MASLDKDNTILDFDLILKGGTVIDPTQGIHQNNDVALKDGRIAALKDRIDDPAAKVIDVSGKLIVPGLIDLHTHVYWGGTSLGIQPEKILAGSGVTTWIDAGSFSFDTACKMLEQGIEPDVVSSDIHAASVNGPAYDLPTTMSKMLNLGMNLDHIVRAVTYNPAEAIGYEKELGSLQVGTMGDVTVLNIEEGDFLFQDCFNNELKGGKRLVPALTVLAGELLTMDVKHNL
jgi:predicted amidohydrolase